MKNARMHRAFATRMSTPVVTAALVACSGFAQPLLADEIIRPQEPAAVKSPEPLTQMPCYEPGKKLPKGLAESSVTITIGSEPKNVWDALVSFETYPHIFKRIKTAQVTRREGDYVFIETYLKPQMFVKNNIQHTVCNVATGPTRLNWKQLDGNFKHVDGSWDLAEAKDGKTKLTYTLHVDAGPVVPPSMVSFLLKFVQREIVGELKQYVEKKQTSNSHSKTKNREPNSDSRTN